MQVPLLPVSASLCRHKPIPAVPEPSPKAVEAWIELQELFNTHPPNVELEHVDFEGGQLIKPTAEILSDFLNITFMEAKAMRNEHAKVVDKIPPFPKDHFKGRGVVTVAGGKYSESLTGSKSKRAGARSWHKKGWYAAF